MAYPVQILNASVPYRGAPVYLRNVKSLNRAKDYAAAGFHVAAIRGLAGGCGEPATGTRGTQGSGADFACDQPLNRDEIRVAWAQAAGVYVDAFNAIAAGTPLVTVREMLMVANDAADKAYALENVEPPRDPGTGAPEPPQDDLGQPSTAGFGGAWWALPIGVGLFLLTRKKGKGKGKKGKKGRGRKGLRLPSTGKRKKKGKR